MTEWEALEKFHEKVTDEDLTLAAQAIREWRTSRTSRTQVKETER